MTPCEKFATPHSDHVVLDGECYRDFLPVAPGWEQVWPAGTIEDAEVRGPIIGYVRDHDGHLCIVDVVGTAVPIGGTDWHIEAAQP